MLSAGFEFASHQLMLRLDDDSACDIIELIDTWSKRDSPDHQHWWGLGDGGLDSWSGTQDELAFLTLQYSPDYPQPVLAGVEVPHDSEELSAELQVNQDGVQLLRNALMQVRNGRAADLVVGGDLRRPAPSFTTMLRFWTKPTRIRVARLVILSSNR